MSAWRSLNRWAEDNGLAFTVLGALGLGLFAAALMGVGSGVMWGVSYLVVGLPVGYFRHRSRRIS